MLFKQSEDTVGSKDKSITALDAFETEDIGLRGEKVLLFQSGVPKCPCDGEIVFVHDAAKNFGVFVFFPIVIDGEGFGGGIVVVEPEGLAITDVGDVKSAFDLKQGGHRGTAAEFAVKKVLSKHRQRTLGFGVACEPTLKDAFDIAPQAQADLFVGVLHGLTKDLDHLGGEDRIILRKRIKRTGDVFCKDRDHIFAASSKGTVPIADSKQRAQTTGTCVDVDAVLLLKTRADIGECCDFKGFVDELFQCTLTPQIKDPLRGPQTE